MDDFKKHNSNNLYNKFVLCPFCGSEAWEIKEGSMQCFLCKARFSPKDLFVKQNVFSINKNLEFLRDMGEFLL